MKIKCLFTATVFFFASINVFCQDAFIGEIRMFAGNFAPINWAFCNGQLLAINDNQALFSILGTTYGGDGETTFALPDLRGRTAVHSGNGLGLPVVTQGQKGGSTSFTLTNNNLPAHSHSGYIKVSDTKGSTFHSSNGYIADSSTVDYQQFTNTAPIGNKTIQGVQTYNTGNGQSVSKRSPFLGVNYIICLYGIYPSMN